MQPAEKPESKVVQQECLGWVCGLELGFLALRVVRRGIGTVGEPVRFPGAAVPDSAVEGALEPSADRPLRSGLSRKVQC